MKRLLICGNGLEHEVQIAKPAAVTVEQLIAMGLQGNLYLHQDPADYELWHEGGWMLRRDFRLSKPTLPNGSRLYLKPKSGGVK